MVSSVGGDANASIGKSGQETYRPQGYVLTRYFLDREEEMSEAARELRFEYAARRRDEVNELKRELKEVAEAG